MMPRALDLLANLFRPVPLFIAARRSPYDKPRTRLTPPPVRRGEREAERRRRAIEAGRITPANGLAT